MALSSRRAALLAGAFHSAVASSLPVGVWSTYTDALPALQLPHVPLAGNGHFGVSLDARSRSVGPGVHGVGPGSANTLDVWMGTTSLWSCTSCGGVDPDRDVPACCSTVALGGVSIRFTPTFPASSPLPSFTAQQDVSDGSLRTAWATPGGGVLETVTRVHPTLDLTVTNVTWTPGAGDPPALLLDASTWVLGDGSVSGSWNTGKPAPASVGCAPADGSAGSPEACGGIPPWPTTAAVSPPQLVYASRNASTVDAIVMPVTAALASCVLTSTSGWVGANVTSWTPGAPPSVPWEATQRVLVQAGGWAAVLTAEAESRGPGLADPVPAALAAVAAAGAGHPGAVSAASDAWWATFWAQSSISLPSQPGVEAFWYGAQYVLGSTSSVDPTRTAPGLYGPWVTTDGPNWHGDFTLDYNYNAPFFGAFGSNHGAQAEVFWGPVLDWMPPARIKAQAQAALANVSCPATALYYACHLAPWGLMSLDPMTRYMTWNGHYTALLFINHFEYTRNVTFAASSTYPLLDGLNAWWSCYLNKTGVGNGTAYVYNDENGSNPDYEHEGQTVPNPQIALSFIYRTLLAQLEIGEDLGLPPPPHILDVASHLPAFNAAAFNMSSNVTFETLPNTRCRNDEQTWHAVPSAAACQALCAASQPACGVFSYCPPLGEEPPGGGCSGTNGQPQPQTCWGYAAAELPSCDRNETRNAGWTSGARTGTSPPHLVDVWTAFKGAGVLESDSFALYPLWPSEALDLGPPAAAGVPGAAALRATAQASSRAYTDFVRGRPVDLFATAVQAGWNASFPLSWSPADVLAGLDAYLAVYQGPNLLPFAPGGGIENTGITRAVNEMLLQSHRWPTAAGARRGRGARADAGESDDSGYVLSIFPFWPREEPSSFTNLLAKGGFLVSAAYDNTTQAVSSPVNVTAAYALNSAPASVVRIVSPWTREPGAVSVTCGGVPTRTTWEGDVLAFSAPAHVPCSVVCAE